MGDLNLNVHNSHKMINGRFVSTKVAQEIAAIDEHFKGEVTVAWIPPELRNEGEAAYAIIHTPDNLHEMILFYVMKDEDFDGRVLLRLLANQQDKNGKATYSQLEAWETAQKRLKEQEWLDELDMLEDITRTALQSPLNTFKVSDDLILTSHLPKNAAHLDEKQQRKEGAPKFNPKEFFGVK